MSSASLYKIALGLAIAGLFFSSCNLPRKGASLPPGSEAATQTVAAQLLQSTLNPNGTAGLIIQTQTHTLIPSLTQALPTTTDTPVPPTATQVPCDRIKFIKDVSYPDDTEVEAGVAFVKTWRLQNAGACTWSSQYALVFTGGDEMGTPTSVALPGYVAPGEMVDVSVTLTAPGEGGTYKGEYKLRNASNIVFGTGEANNSFYVQIKVASAGSLVYDFLANASSAEWKSGSGSTLDTALTFSGADDDANGTAKFKEGVKLENGATYTKVLLTFPKHTTDGNIGGTFDDYTVKKKDHFRARVGFYTADGICHAAVVKFRLNAMIGGTLDTIQTWEKPCNGDLLAIDYDLSAYKGKTVQFMLTVLADGAYDYDWAVWINPRIVQP